MIGEKRSYCVVEIIIFYITQTFMIYINFVYIITDITEDTFLRKLGYEYTKLCLAEYGRSLSMMGSNMIEFFSNMDGLHDHIRTSPKFGNQVPPSFRCVYTPSVTFHFYSDRRNMLDYYAGIVQAVAELMFTVEININIQPSDNLSSNHHIFHIKPVVPSLSKQHCSFSSFRSSFSDNPSDSKIGVSTFCMTFPFHVIFDRSLKISQLGNALMKMIAPEIAKRGLQFNTYFGVHSPQLEPLTFSKLLSRVNFNFVLGTHSVHKAGSELSQVIWQNHYLKAKPS